jgi:hypothetical protein
MVSCSNNETLVLILMFFLFILLRKKQFPVVVKDEPGTPTAAPHTETTQVSLVRFPPGPDESSQSQACIQTQAVRKRIETVLERYKLSMEGDNVVECLSMAVEQRLRDVLQMLVDLANRRIETEPTDYQIVTTSDTKTTLRLIEKREKEIATRKEEEEKERLLEAAKANKKENKEDKQLQDKLNKVVQEEEAKRTNVTALQAVGDIRIKPFRGPQKSASNPSRAFSLRVGSNPAAPGAARVCYLSVTYLTGYLEFGVINYFYLL